MTDDEMMHCSQKGRQMERLRAIMHRLRAPGGCPWDAEQSHESIIGNLLEEAYEVVDTIQRGDWAHLEEELGDLLLQVVFHAEIAAGAGRFDFDDVARGISEKLVRRHPHVYGDAAVGDTDGVLSQWERIKREEKGIAPDAVRPYLEGVGKGLPAMLRAAKLQKKAAKVGFDWPDARSIMAKVREELEEVEEELEVYEHGDAAHTELEEELGDLLFVVVNVCRKLGVNPELAVELTNRKFERRFGEVERRMGEEGLELGQVDLEWMNGEWEKAKSLPPEGE